MTEREKKVCEIYRKRDENGKVHCNECPLVISHRDLTCKANTEEETEDDK